MPLTGWCSWMVVSVVGGVRRPGRCCGPDVVAAALVGPGRVVHVADVVPSVTVVRMVRVSRCRRAP